LTRAHRLPVLLRLALALAGRLLQVDLHRRLIGLDVGHERLMLLQQRLGGILVLSIVLRVHNRLLLAHPRLSLGGVREVLLRLQRVIQILLPLLGLVLQQLPLALQRHNPLLDISGGKVRPLDHILGLVTGSPNPGLVACQLRHERLMLLAHVLHTDQITATTGRRRRANSWLFLPDPRLLVLDVPEQLLQLQRLGQLQLTLLDGLKQRVELSY